MTRRFAPLLALLAGLALFAGACGDDGDDGDASTTSEAAEEAELVVYSGRDEELVGPLIDMFEEESGITTEVRYGDSAEMAAALLEEGENTPADVFYSQEVGTVGALSKAGLLSPLPADVVEQVPERYRPLEGTDWVGVTGRSRVIVVNPDVLDEVPSTVEDLTDPAYEGQVGWAPGNASFQSFVTAFRVGEGEQAASDWLDAMIENDTQTYENNVAILEAVESGELGAGLINHYYWARMADEVGGADDMSSELVFLTAGDPGALVNATAVAITTTGADNSASLEFVEFLLSPDAQEYFVTETKEYPLVPGIEGPADLPALEELVGPEIDLGDLDSVEETITVLTDKGLLG